ncbi:TPR repeat domain protein [Candidatus Rhodobacter oscarellae]|uniref:TPR repeat domain protein n=1 Tax=Candidatus Rhodobacter oscarellae TaxID=1675527 RepID=A0A0J9E0R5_9RHOB|nr:TPR repeat domain protein [Candidatus Rhodobacter lobularis]
MIAFGSDYVAQNPLDFEVLTLMAEAYLTLRFVNEAETLFQILYTQQRSARTVAGLGLAKSSLGNFKEARTLFKEALMLNSDYLPAWSGLTEIHRYSRQDPVLKRLQRAITRNKRRPEVEGTLHYLMCKAMNDMGKWAQAWQHAERGAALLNKTNDPSGLWSWQTDQAAVATADLLAAAPQTQVDSEGLIFVVGMPRSGTSLLETMLSNAPGVFGCGELCFVSDVARNMSAGDIAAGREHASHAWLRDWSVESRAQVAEAYVSDLYARSGKGKYTRFIDKFPGNIICLPHISLLFPKARIIRMHRNPVDSCISNYLGQFAGGNTYTYNVDDLAETYAAYQACADTITPRLPNPVLEVRYEDLVGQPESEMRRILGFLDLSWDAACIAPEQSTTPCVTRSRGQVRSKISSKAVGRWRRYGDLARPLAQALDGHGIDIEDAGELLAAAGSARGAA